jgi:Domain of unknown function DUF29
VNQDLNQDLNQDIYLDFYKWAKEQANYIRIRNWAEVDIKNLAEEIEALARNEEKELGNHIQSVLICLLKAHYQPERRGAIRESDSIEDHRDRIRECLEDSPSLELFLKNPKWIDKYYQRACLKAAKEMQKSIKTLPFNCPYRFDQICMPDFVVKPIDNGDFYTR